MLHTIRDSCGTALGYGLNDREFESRQGLGIFLLTPSSTTALGPTQPPIQCVPGPLSLGVKRAGHEADNSLHLVPRSRMCGAILPLPNTFSWHGVPLKIKHRDNFTFNLCGPCISKQWNWEYMEENTEIAQLRETSQQERAVSAHSWY
jgi:hypothetical protein